MQENLPGFVKDLKTMSSIGITNLPLFVRSDLYVLSEMVKDLLDLVGAIQDVFNERKKVFIIFIFSIATAK